MPLRKTRSRRCPPPDPDPVSPALVLPPGACDAHCHVFGPADKFPYAADRSYTPPDAPVENLRRLHAKLGVSRAVIVHASCHGTDMEVTLDAIASSEGRYRGVACVEDRVTDRELERLHAGRHSRDSIQLRQTFGRCSGSGRVLSFARAHQAFGMACRAALRCRRHREPARAAGPHRCAVHHRSHGTGKSG